jgi:hypothetical protein
LFITHFHSDHLESALWCAVRCGPVHGPVDRMDQGARERCDDRATLRMAGGLVCLHPQAGPPNAECEGNIGAVLIRTLLPAN